MQKIFFSIFAMLFITATAGAQQTTTYPVIVSFNSMCCGVPLNEPVMKLIKTFKKQYKIKKISVDSIGPMGKEGEYFLAFRLKELSKPQKVKFIEQLKKITPIMKDQGSADIKENETVNKAELSTRTAITTLKL